ncbi:hypothetical protein GCM10009716_00160 [Streptomyces sodiiphilus]|uniref:Uncharacterized protein n=1 Tax=Streptomyces sodiiphilus TaxID=226217 RepID=A0ABN2NQ84_9ACTN
MAASAVRTFLRWAIVKEKRTPRRRQAATILWEQNAESPRTMIWPLTPMARTVLTASAIRWAAPLAEPAEPLRSREATMTGAAIGVEAVTIWKCRPRCLV